MEGVRGGGGGRRAMLTKFMLKILGGSEATGLWPGARPNHGPHFHVRVSLWHVYSPPLRRAGSGRSGPPGPREGGRRWLWEVGCVPLAGRAGFPSESITAAGPDVRSGSRPGHLGDV